MTVCIRKSSLLTLWHQSYGQTERLSTNNFPSLIYTFFEMWHHITLYYIFYLHHNDNMERPLIHKSLIFIWSFKSPNWFCKDIIIRLGRLQINNQREEQLTLDYKFTFFAYNRILFFSSHFMTQGYSIKMSFCNIHDSKFSFMFPPKSYHP